MINGDLERHGLLQIAVRAPRGSRGLHLHVQPVALKRAPKVGEHIGHQLHVCLAELTPRNVRFEVGKRLFKPEPFLTMATLDPDRKETVDINGGGSHDKSPLLKNSHSPQVSERVRALRAELVEHLQESLEASIAQSDPESPNRLLKGPLFPRATVIAATVIRLNHPSCPPNTTMLAEVC